MLGHCVRDHVLYDLCVSLLGQVAVEVIFHAQRDGDGIPAIGGPGQNNKLRH